MLCSMKAAATTGSIKEDVLKKIISFVVLCSLTILSRPLPFGAASNMALPDCGGTLTVAPKDIVLACGDGNTAIENVAWHGWGESIASGDGNYSYNDCTPNCVSGHVHSERGLIIVWGKQRCPAGHSAYARMLIVTPGDNDPKSFPAPPCGSR